MALAAGAHSRSAAPTIRPATMRWRRIPVIDDVLCLLAARGAPGGPGNSTAAPARSIHDQAGFWMARGDHLGEGGIGLRKGRDRSQADAEELLRADIGRHDLGVA